MADDAHYQEPTRQYKTQATNQHEEIGGVNFGALEMSPQAKNENSYLNNKNTVEEDAFSPLRGRSQNPNQRLNWGPWFTVATIIFMIISLTSLTLNILVIKGIIVAPAFSERASRTQDRNNINRPYEPTSNLLEKIKAMEKNLTSLITKLQEKLASVGGSDKIKNITNMITAMKLEGGQKGPQGLAGSAGPPGVAGAGNLTRCEHVHKYHTATAQHSSTDKASVPYIVPKDKIVLGVTCSTVGGDETYLEDGKISTGQTSYLCNCLGRSTYQHTGKAKTSLKCLIDVWVCPTIS